MPKAEKYANGQRVYEQIGNMLTYFYKDGTVKTQGRIENGQMEGEWQFFRQEGQLWQTGSFAADVKHGRWIRYDKSGEVAYSEIFNEGKLVRGNKRA